jgi:hypothetical protein
MDFTINTQTTGFGSPARAYVNKRLNPNDLLIKDIYTTFFFQWEGDSKLDLIQFWVGSKERHNSPGIPRLW